jgi:type II secretory pathway pseudopilin PulG
LIELIVVLALLGLIATTASAMLWFSADVVKASNKEYQFQFSTRMLMQETSSIVRYASAVFTIPTSSFRADNLAEGWDYIGIQPVVITPAQDGNPAVLGNEVVQYTFNNTTKAHMPVVLLAAQVGVDYEFVFNRVDPQSSDTLLQFTVQSIPNGSVDEFGLPKAQLTVITEVEARNSLQVVDLSTPIDPAIAIAFRRQDRSVSVVGHVAMVLDNSGSMADNLAGNNGTPSRISILKTETQTIVNSFAQESNIDISLIPFATSANDPYPFYNAHDSLSSLTGIINGFNAIGGTNTGDGLRRAYWNLKTHAAEVPSNVTVKSYVIVLVDGVTTFASVISNTNRSFVVDNRNVNEGYLDRSGENSSSGQIAGNGTYLDAKGTGYVNLIGAMLDSNSFSKVYVIGFSSIHSELDSVNDIAAACGAPSDRVFRADSQTALDIVLTTIRQDIVNDLWYLQGPPL